MLHRKARRPVTEHTVDEPHDHVSFESRSGSEAKTVEPADQPRAFDPEKPLLPANYSAAKVALAQCAKIDEAKSYADKAKALAVYAAQAEDESLLNYAKRIRARAVRRQGELLKEIEPAKGANQNIKVGAHPKVTRKSIAASAGLSEEQQKTAIRVANVPKDQFEQQVEGPKPPTVQTLAQQGLARRAETSAGRAVIEPTAESSPPISPPTSEPTTPADPPAAPTRQRATKTYTTLLDAWRQCPPEERRKFMRHIGAAFVDRFNDATGNGKLS